MVHMPSHQLRWFSFFIELVISKKCFNSIEFKPSIYIPSSFVKQCRTLQSILLGQNVLTDILKFEDYALILFIMTQFFT